MHFGIILSLISFVVCVTHGHRSKMYKREIDEKWKDAEKTVTQLCVMNCMAPGDLKKAEAEDPDAMAESEVCMKHCSPDVIYDQDDPETLIDVIDPLEGIHQICYKACLRQNEVTDPDTECQTLCGIHSEKRFEIKKGSKKIGHKQ